MQGTKLFLRKYNESELGQAIRFDQQQIHTSQKDPELKITMLFSFLLVLFLSKLKCLSNHLNATEIGGRLDYLIYLYTLQQIS